MLEILGWIWETVQFGGVGYVIDWLKVVLDSSVFYLKPQKLRVLVNIYVHLCYNSVIIGWKLIRRVKHLQWAHEPLPGRISLATMMGGYPESAQSGGWHTMFTKRCNWAPSWFIYNHTRDAAKAIWLTVKNRIWRAGGASTVNSWAM